MGQPHVEAGGNAYPPARLVVSLPRLTIQHFELHAVAADTAMPAMVPATAYELFGQTSREVISGEIVPALLSNQVWSGELRPLEPSTNNDTSVTLWIPHHVEGGAPAEATVLIGTAATVHTSTVAPDPLTGLPTRLVLLDRLDQARRRSRRTDDLTAALFIDLDGLKVINDRHGHEVGDSALIAAAERLRSCMREGDTVARFGGDEFVVLCKALENESQASMVADRILDQLGNNEQPLAASIGIAFDRGGRLSPLELVGRSDAAMYRAKSRGGRRYEIFDSEMQGRLAADEELRVRLLDAIGGNGLDVASQPLFELGNGRVFGVELFIRLRDGNDDQNLVSASDVLRLAREHSEAIDAAMLGRVIAVAKTWRRELGRKAPRVHMNISAQSLASTEFVRRVGDALERHRLNPAAIAFEVDSQDFAPIEERQLATLLQLRELGAAVVIDGYGNGPASLRIIDRLRPSLVKVTSLDATRSTQLPAPVVIGLLRGVSSLGISTCVKGLETPALLEQVATAGAFGGQGNVLAPVAQLSRTRSRLDQSARIGF